MENNNELEMMRAQVALLKEKLDKEQMVSEKLLRTVVKKEMKTFSRDKIMLIITALVVMPLLLGILLKDHGISIALAIVMELYMIIALTYTFYSHRGLDSKTMGNSRLVDIGKKLVHLQRLNTLWLRFSIPFICILLPWMFIEFGILEWPLNSVTTGGLTGFAIGMTFGIIEVRKKKRKLNELVKQIEELSNEEIEQINTKQS